MNKHLYLLFISIFISLFQPDSVLSEKLIIDSEEQFQFALQYMEKEEYSRAIVELERLIHFFPNNRKVPKARLLIGECYLKQEEYESARKVLENVYTDYTHTTLAGKALFLIGESYYLQGASDEAEHYFIKVIKDHPDTELRNAALFRLGWSQMRAERWREASETFTMVEESSPLYPFSLDLSKKSLQGEHLPRKDPVAAGIMAGIVPGLGHIYCERYKDGMVALLLNGLFIWAAVESFDQDHDVLGGILTFLEAGWYSGNIYSAVNCSHKYNRKIKKGFFQILPDNLKLNLFTTRDHHLGLALKIDF